MCFLKQQLFPLSSEITLKNAYVNKYNFHWFAPLKFVFVCGSMSSWVNICIREGQRFDLGKRHIPAREVRGGL